MDIRPLTPDDVSMLIDWAADEGWNPGLADVAPFRAADPEGFLGGFVDGRMVAGISAVRYGADFGFIGLYICRPDMRGKGYGKQVWDAGMRHLQGRTIGLDGVPEQQANYAAMGFRPVYETFRWSGSLKGCDTGASGITVLGVEDALIPDIVAFDARHFPALRENFLRQWVALPRMAQVALLGGTVAGYGVARRCLDGVKIGPLFAENMDVAQALLNDLVASCGGDTVHLDVPETNAGFSDLLADAGLQRGFTTARMYRGQPPEIRQEGVFAVTTLELG